MHTRPATSAHILLALLLACLLAWRPATAQDGPPPEMRRVVDATVALLAATDRASITAFADQHLDPAYRQSMPPARLVEHIEALRAASRPHRGDLGVEGEPDGVRLLFGGEAGVQLRLRVGPATRWKITELSQLDARIRPGTDASMQADPRDAAIRRHVKAFERLGQLDAKAGLAMLEAEHLAAGLPEGASRQAMLADLAGLRQVIAAAGIINLEQRGEQIALQFRGGKPGDVVFAIADEAPFKITKFEIDLNPKTTPREPAPPLAWEQLDTRLSAAERDGFSGVVIAQRGGRTTLSHAYGFADSGNRRPLTADSVFDIGSMPIDFTRAAILLLQQEGRLTLDDSLGKYFPEAPADKRGIRLQQLMDGSSGLANFHHRDGDPDKDLSYIDRDTATRRIFAQPLLFAPGDGQSHSHSAFGLLAMVVEVVSGDSYAAFLRKRLFVPAGMSRTGYYGEMLGLEAADFAIGYGQAAATPNIPPLWGPVSWLVLGSGGMVSSVADMQRGYNYIASGKLLQGDALADYLRLRVGAGGSDRGFFFLRVGGDDGDAVFLASNSGAGPDAHGQLVRSLIGMVLPDRGDGPGP